MLSMLFEYCSVTFLSSSCLKDNSSAIAFNFGPGCEYYITDKLKLEAEAVYQTGKKDGVTWDWYIFSAGIVIDF